MADLTASGKETYDQVKALLEEETDEGLLEAYREQKQDVDRLTGSLQAIKDLLLGRMILRGEEKLDKPAGLVRVQAGRETSTIVAAKLLEQGVTVEIIEQATEKKQGDPYVVITVRNPKEG